MRRGRIRAFPAGRAHPIRETSRLVELLKERILNEAMMSNALADVVLMFLTQTVVGNPLYAVPREILTLMIWRVARLRPCTSNYPYGVNPENYQEKVMECLRETMEEQVAERLAPLLQQLNVGFPPHATMDNLIDTVAQQGPPDTLAFLCYGYNDMVAHGVTGQFCQGASAIVPFL